MRKDVLKAPKVGIIISSKEIHFSSCVTWMHKQRIRDTKFRRNL